MKKRLLAFTLGLCLLAGCGAPAVETVTPTETPATVTPTLEPTPAPVRGDLTQEEIDRANEAFYWEQITAEGYRTSSDINGFFRSYYEDVRKMNFGAFINYYPVDSEDMSDEEWEKVYAISKFNEIPAHRVRRERVDETLQKYAGITTAELDTSEEIYLEDYESWYYYASDFDPGMFVCQGGRIEGDTVILWTGEEQAGIGRELTLQKVGENWYIKSHLPVAIDREKSLFAFVIGLAEEEVESISDSWGIGRIPEVGQVVELLHTALQNSTYSWEYQREGEPLCWDMTLYLSGGKELILETGLIENVVKISDKTGDFQYFRAPALYWLLRKQYDSEEKENAIDRAAYETYQEAVEGYLTEEAWDPAVRVKLTDFSLKQESEALGAQVWVIEAELTTDPPELAVKLVGNGYVDSQLRMYPISGDGPSNLMVVMDGEVLGFRDWTWFLDFGGLEQYATREELRGAFEK